MSEVIEIGSQPEVSQPEPLPTPEWNFAEDKEALLGLIEALTLASPTAITKESVAEVLAHSQITLELDLIQEGIDALVARYNEDPARGLNLVNVAGGISFRTNSRYGPFVRTLFKEKPQKLSNSQLEVLSIVSYRQPITRAEIEEIRGVDCSGSMRKLLNVKLIKILGKSHGMGRPLLYGTTKEFLEFFGLNSLHDLPTLREYEELTKGDGPDEVKPETSETIQVMDLFEGHESAKVDYEERERMSREALESLDKALHRVANAAEKLEIHTSTNN